MTNKAAATTDILETKKKDLFLIDPRNVEIQSDFNGRQTFDEEAMTQLKESIKAVGVKVPILVKKMYGTDKFALINGERRVKASMELIAEGHELRLPATIFTGNDTDAIVSMLITNDGVKLSLVEEAEVMTRLSNLGLTQKEISAKTGRTTTQLSSLKTIQNAPQKVKKLIAENKISSTTVISLLREHKENPDVALSLIEKSVEISGTKKVTAKTINKASDKINSFSFLKEIVKSDEKAIKNYKDKLFSEFLLGIVKNTLTKDQIEEFLFENK